MKRLIKYICPVDNKTRNEVVDSFAQPKGTTEKTCAKHSKKKT